LKSGERGGRVKKQPQIKKYVYFADTGNNNNNNNTNTNDNANDNNHGRTSHCTVAVGGGGGALTCGKQKYMASKTTKAIKQIKQWK